MESKKSIVRILQIIFLAVVGLYVVINFYKYGVLTETIMMGIIGVVVLTVAIHSSTRKNKSFESTKALGQYIEENWNSEFWFKDKEAEAEKIAGNYYFNISVAIIFALAVLFLVANKIVDNMTTVFGNSNKVYGYDI